jgi:hypothetical protein
MTKKLLRVKRGVSADSAAAPPSKLARGKIISRYNITYT